MHLSEDAVKKVVLSELRALVAEAIVLNEDGTFLNGVPEWQLRQDVEECVGSIRERIRRFILVNKSENLADQQNAIAAMNDACDDLEKKLYDVVEDALWSFTRRV